ncbi:hypothetical protein BAE44_0010832 [Dichanthelium oligosanthes]|uniref:Major facilitator superfamily (MFS) profile domain-containing protein n=1 Tax=Dichanthelium oligosanthes TaxID=888268 RepID=A0A1E5VSR3_9POAL|nr:hypothetical protein BAE44_0010832 [Dichanthelium oligosanthes]
MLIGGALFIAGSVVNTGAVNISMLIVGRTLLGFGIVFTLQAAPLYLADTAPPRWRGAFTISTTLCVSIVELHVFIKLLCAMKDAVFLFYTGWLLVMTPFVAALLPETKGVPLEAMRSVWARHWYWRRFVKDDAKQEIHVNRARSTS